MRFGAAGTELFVAVGEEGDRGGVGLGGVGLGCGDHAVLVAHQKQRALELRGNVYARDRDALGLGQLLDECRRAAQVLVRWRHKGKLAVIDGGEQLGRHAGFVGLGAGLGGAGT